MSRAGQSYQKEKVGKKVCNAEEIDFVEKLKRQDVSEDKKEQMKVKKDGPKGEQGALSGHQRR